jgi:hydroxyacylglutathione hydrolase
MRKLKGFFVVVVTIAVLVCGTAGLIRFSRTRSSAPRTVKANLVSVENAGGIYLFAARVGPHVVMFDTGLDPEGRPVDVALGALGAGREDVTDVFLTHGHMDHIAGAARLERARIHLGAGDVALASGRELPEAVVAQVLARIAPGPPVSTNDALSGPAAVDVGNGRTVRALPVPGHTPGSYAFLYDGVLFVGDIMTFKEGQLEPPPKLFDPHPEENRASIRSLKTQLGSDAVETVCTAHGGCTPTGLGQSLLDDLVSRV